MDEKQIKGIVQKMMQQTQYNVASVSYHAHTGTDSPRVAARNLSSALFSTATVTTGTAPVLVFTTLNAPINATITGAFLISNDTTAGNISIYNTTDGNQRTVATIAKGTVAGALVGATALTNSTMATLVTVVSDSAGNSTVFLTFST